MNIEKTQSPIDRAIVVIANHGGLLRTRQALDAGIHPRTLYAMRDSGIIEPLCRGLYRLVDSPPLANPDLVTVALKVSGGVVCLISALAYHDLTTQIPHRIHVALPRGAEEPRLDYPPLHTYRISGHAYSEGIEIHKIDNVKVRIYSPEKTIVDCYKYRNKIGLDICLESLRLYRERRKPKIDLLMHYARICRMENVMRPYLEAILG